MLNCFMHLGAFPSASMDSKRPQFLSLLLLLAIFSLFFKAPLSIASDTLFPGQSLTGNQTISSQDGKFELGFFKSGNSTSQNYYIGIWYKKIQQKTPVWVANRDKPLPDTSSELRFSYGNLVLLSQSKIPIWSSNSTSGGSNSAVAVLLETGNLVLRDGSNSSDIFWQSFDHPTDTWLPGGKLGLNKVTGENQVLYSWKNSENPARGMFSLEIDPNGSSQYYLVWNRSTRYWTSGVWNGQTFSLVPEMTANYIYNFSYVSNDKENYFTYTTMDSSLVSRFVMDVSGQIQQLTWLESSQQWMLFWSRPSDRCEAYSLCGAFSFCSQTTLPFCRCLQGFTPRSPIDWNFSDWSAGCSRRTPIQCESNSSAKGERDGFLMMRVVNFPENPQSSAAGSVQDCESACLNNCSCTAYAYGSQCSLWYGDLFDLKHLSVDVGDGSPLYIRLAASELPNSGGKKRLVAGIIAGVAGLVAILGMILAMILCYRRRRRNSEESEDEKIFFYPTWAASRLAEGEVIGVLDSRLEGNAVVEELQRALRVACWCIQDDENHRPSMGQVVQMLEGVLDVSIPPIPRTLQIITENQEPVVFSSESTSDRNSRAKDNLSASSQGKSMSSTSS
ncbi:hypothetical protein MRB53_024336 [Persea americana]|uniref:Uncharacterized protein n=1 Tax=Persea americana TaxID=3435 RepID=A0ACC2LCG9_PERAE|nr:hypothetical protein MRB53_024336 [Persea americana]